MVEPQDRIISVNGVAGTPEDTMHGIKEAQDVLKLKVLHYDWSKYPATPFGSAQLSRRLLFFKVDIFSYVFPFRQL